VWVLGKFLCVTCYEQFSQEYADNYQWEEDKTMLKKEMVCPYCGCENGESWEVKADDGEIECDECGKEFMYCRNYEVTYTTWRKKDE